MSPKNKEEANFRFKKFKKFRKDALTVANKGISTETVGFLLDLLPSL